MRGSIRIFTVRGVQVRAHYSFLLVLPLLAFVFARTFASAAHAAKVPPSELGGAPLVWGFGMAVALFAAVLTHELAHTLVGLAHGAKVRDITLLMIGGVSTMVEPPKRLGDEALMAAVGPLTSLALAAAFYALYRYVDTTLFNLRFGLYYFSQLNLALGVFNLVPAFPMDGGRVLRALLAARLGLVRGTELAAGLGKVLAGVLAVLGALGLNVVLLFIAYFVYVGARGEAVQVALHAALEGVPVGDLMRPSATSVDVSDSVARAGGWWGRCAWTMSCRRFGCMTCSPLASRRGGTGADGARRMARG